MSPVQTATHTVLWPVPHQEILQSEQLLMSSATPPDTGQVPVLTSLHARRAIGVVHDTRRHRKA